jgi:general secretion pathway protein M
MRAWWNGRTRREQILLGVMLLCMGLVLILFGVVRPLQGAARAASERYAAALTTEAEVARNVAAIARIKAPARPGLRRAPLEAAVNTTAAAAGVVLGRVEADPAGGLRVAAPSVAPTVLFPWLSLLQRERGVVASHLTIVKNDTGGLTLDATLVRVGS